MADQPTILIIDNDEGMVRAIATRLEHFGYICLTANTGSQGVAICNECDVDLVITDLNMPMGNGVQLAHTIRRASDVPIIVVTGYRDEFQRELRAVRNITTLRKPVDPNQLLELVETELVMAGRTLP